MPPECRIQPPSQEGCHFPATPGAPWLLPSPFGVADITNIGINRHQSNPKNPLEPDIGSLSQHSPGFTQ
jgi:hypothetical protein